MKRVLVFYRELAGYFLACLEHLCDTYDVHADVVAYPVNSDAPFQFEHSNRIKIISRQSLNAEQLKHMAADDQYRLIFTGGWFDKDYLAALKHRNCPAMLGFDNQWKGSLKHHLSSVYGRIFIRPLFDYAFVPGSKQATFARHLGFDETKIIGGIYSCDSPKFAAIQRHGSQPKRLVYTGRYAPEKFTTQLFEAFCEVTAELNSDWQLHAVGTGPLWNQRLMADNIHHYGFMQPDELLRFMTTGDAFILPSIFEPWGVVVHEFASAGYPLLLSNEVGAAEAFLRDEENGFLFQFGNKAAMKTAMRRLMLLSNNQLIAMGNRSRTLAASISPETWASSVYAVMK